MILDMSNASIKCKSLTKKNKKRKEKEKKNLRRRIMSQTTHRQKS